MQFKAKSYKKLVRFEKFRQKEHFFRTGFNPIVEKAKFFESFFFYA
jgi:hypothetical protein